MGFTNWKFIHGGLVCCFLILIVHTVQSPSYQLPPANYVQEGSIPEFTFIQPVTEPIEKDLPKDLKYGAYVLTPEQQYILLLAEKIGQEVGYPETVQAIAMQETLAGAFGDGIGDKSLPVLERSYGIMQVKVVTAMFVLRHFPEIKEKYFKETPLTPVNIRDELLNNHEANITIGAHNFLLMVKYTPNWRSAVVAYNRGIAGYKRVNVDTHHYLKGIAYKLNHVIRPFNQDERVVMR